MWAPCRCTVDTFVQYNHNSLLAGSVDCDKSSITFFPMKIICAGFPKTGTKSMAAALRELGYSVNDFPEHLHGGLFFCQSNLVVKKLKMIWSCSHQVSPLTLPSSMARSLWRRWCHSTRTWTPWLTNPLVIFGRFSFNYFQMQRWLFGLVALMAFWSTAQVILMERENADEWLESYLGMLDFYNQNIRPWYQSS